MGEVRKHFPPKIHRNDIMRRALIKNADFDYYVYENGEVFSTFKNKFLVKKMRTDGYFVVSIKRFGKSTWYPIHRLVAEEFIPNPENKPCVNHKDGNKLNNEVSNLEWCTYGENAKHAFANGLKEPTKLFGEEHGMSKLTIEVVRHIRKNYVPRDKEFGQHALARRFGVDQYTIWAVINNKTWKGV